MQLIMNLGVLMVLLWQRLRRRPKNCKLLLPTSFLVILLPFGFHVERKFQIFSYLIAFNVLSSTECQLVMNVLWTRLSETGKDWRYVYKVTRMRLFAFSVLTHTTYPSVTCSSFVSGISCYRVFGRTWS